MLPQHKTKEGVLNEKLALKKLLTYMTSVYKIPQKIKCLSDQRERKSIPLFNIVMPDRAYFGQKDAQQLAVIKRMVADLNIPVEIIGCPIVREADGLAKSSRNTYLNEEERKAALILSKTIFMGQELVKNGLTDAAELVRKMKENIETEPLATIDYVDVVNFDDISKKDTIGDNTLVAMAVYVGKARLLDNFIIEKK